MLLKKAPTTVVAMKLLIGCITVMWAVFDWCRRRTFTDRNCINRHKGLFVLEKLVPRPLVLVIFFPFAKPSAYTSRTESSLS